jgi:2-polyprenyl-3-methyl-5-hydroxy-6-metoxy-1,4-benzoquinol methylase
MTHQLWNRLAQDFEVAVCDVTSSNGAELAKLVRRARPSRSQTLVDAGCGIGSFVKRFGRRFGQVIAFDFAAKMVSRAKRQCANVPGVAWQTLALKDAADQLGPVGDFVACLNVITSTDAELRERQWASLAGLAKPGGHVLVVVPSLESALHVVRFADAENLIHQSNFDDGLVYRGDAQQKHYARLELRDTLCEHDLRVLVLKRIHYPWSDDGVDDPGLKPPWSWVALARRRMR